MLQLICCLLATPNANFASIHSLRSEAATAKSNLEYEIPFDSMPWKRQGSVEVINPV